MSNMHNIVDENQPLLQIDQQSFEQIYRAHWKSVYAVCLYHSKDDDLAKEFTQDIFKSLWERRKELVIKTSVQHYLIRAAKLKVFDHYRKKSVSERYESFHTATYTEADKHTEEDISYKDLLQRVEYLLSTLPQQSYKVYTLSQEQGIPNKEIALLLGISEKTVEYHLSKARTLLRKNLIEYRY